MAHVINQDICIKCGTCESVCPVGAVAFNGDDYIIDEAKCEDCAVCAENCPVQCIAPKS
ncbi:MAG: 4Fe-4S binding protein [Alphaproteobacteria bacterium]|jgi:benzoyl-CoA 2,3-dioxygenase component A|nr:4Fe-4S binding protein [Alphaproteobacteria bacterium]